MDLPPTLKLNTQSIVTQTKIKNQHSKMLELLKKMSCLSGQLIFNFKLNMTLPRNFIFASLETSLYPEEILQIAVGKFFMTSFWSFAVKLYCIQVIKNVCILWYELIKIPIKHANKHTCYH